MLSKLLAFLMTRLVTTEFLVKLALFASEKLVKSSKPKWDDELHAMVEEALK
ncbi:hypothetical protein [Pseudoalteromonas sp. SWYJZ19]|uniref:hypothetical protein n=1 Tax=Pseudoalteromonas sp. SWYJZ19 TaxID=2792068 RepID=UPI0018CF5EEA|nr:hypothetical protein [Pseudoalteromonas sp. SWYJZ19]MBH0050727.1 hypothetical protein [Pseudoalteromonas sp. SWYJZ19]